ncbi:MAG: UDP-glucose:undecaprenyl-phosphate glucose-1-phosphate transferase [Anaerolineales bacterium]|nr:UDP-glucose:undecaprenyl-phosphate glucose-1-phosphate transferase [Anaerolineales bacterium]
MIRRFSVNFAVFSILVDAALIAAMLWLMAYARPALSRLEGLPFIQDISQPVRLPFVLYLLFPAVWVAIMLFLSVYDGRRNLRIVDEFSSLTLSALLAGISLAGLLYLSFRDISRVLFLTFALSTYLALLVWRVPARALYRWRNRKLGRQQRVLILGAGVVGRSVKQELEKFREQIHVIGFLDDDATKREQAADILGALSAARVLVQQQGADEIILALPLRAHEQMSRVLETLFDLPVRIKIVPDYFQWALHHADVEDFSGIPMLDVRAPALTDNQRMVKRFFDIICTCPILIFALPVMALVSLAIWLDDGPPVLFRQKRIGENGRVFIFYKFRTMIRDAETLRHSVQDADENGNPIYKHKDDPRVTRVGAFLRRWSLDELPQFFNVLRGSMSLVGPRPEMPYLVEQYQPWQRKRFAVPQGLTGWWQIHGRSDKPMHLHTEDDLYYIQNYSIWLDIQILIQTFWIVLRGKGAY